MKKIVVHKTLLSLPLIRETLKTKLNCACRQTGQSLVEMVFAIGIIALVITGVVVLVTSSVGVKNNSFERKKAMEMAEIIMEDLVDQKRNNSANFWNLTTKMAETLPEFNGYLYAIGYSGMDCGGNNCVSAIVTIKWGDDRTLEVSKFFSRDVN